mgnify:CR=1 FL=1
MTSLFIIDHVRSMRSTTNDSTGSSAGGDGSNATIKAWQVFGVVCNRVHSLLLGWHTRQRGLHEEEEAP